MARFSGPPKVLALIMVIGCLAALAGCGPTAGRTLPTRLAVAAISSEGPPGSANNLVPATWTPSPLSDAAGFVAVAAAQAPVSGVGFAAQATLPSRTPTASPTPTVTATPTETATPTAHIPLATILASLAPNPELGPSKLGLDVIRNNSPNIMDFVRQTQPAVMKAVDDFGFLIEVRAASPRTIIVGRVNDDFSQNYIGNPEEAAQEYVQKHLPVYLSNPAVDYWEGWNEPDPNLEYMAWYTRFEQERVRLMAASGLRSAIGGFSPGTPELDEFALFVPAVATAKEYGGILTLHEGELGSGDLRDMYGTPFIGYPTYADRGLMTFRYRWFYRELLEPADLVIPLVISELNFSGWSNLPLERFIPQLAWYDAEARRDGYVIGFSLFTAGAFGQWADYDMNVHLPDLAAYVNSQR
jgi:hypothetical protein